jgi:hypothetical protein
VDWERGKVAGHDDRNRLRKLAGNMSEEDRKKQLAQATEQRREMETSFSNAIVNQDKLVDLTEKIWLAVPVSQRARFTAEDWQRAIYDRCTPSLQRAEAKLEENKQDEKMFVAKVKILRQTFAAQVVHAMQTVAEKYRSMS